jgi:hypothetical protein
MSQQQGQQIAKEESGAQAGHYSELRTRTWINKKAFGFYKEGFLELRDGRVTFTRKGNEKVFDSPLGEVQAEFPIYMWGGGTKLTVGGQLYYISFARPGNSRSVIGGITSIMAYRRWKEVLTSG